MPKTILIINSRPERTIKEYPGCDVIVNYNDGNFLINGAQADVSNVGPMIDSLGIETYNIVGYLNDNLSLIDGWEDALTEAFEIYGVTGVYSDIFDAACQQIYPLLSHDIHRGWSSPFVFLNMKAKPQISLFFTDEYIQSVLMQMPILKLIEPLVILSTAPILGASS